ncbi:MAG: hypothetical protein C6Y22_23030 [Hapalosiphonaceae cyanobacterium JJU2]|nr:MAG: hypothetical protein C6Y22_23030 [Hapalosiphonaceae cyanobacterium JJU2]
MTEAIVCSLITDTQDLQYIFDVVNQVLDNNHVLGSIKDVQTALKEVSLEHGMEIQMNLIFEENYLTGFNFSFKNEPTKTTATIPFKQQEIEIQMESGCIIPHEPPTTTIDVATTEVKGNLSISDSTNNKIIVAPGLQVEGQCIITPENSEIEETLKSPSLGFEKINPALINLAQRLESRNEIDGLWLTGLTLKAGISLASTLQTENKPDSQAAGLAIIKRFGQVLPQEFAELKTGTSAKVITWKDPQSSKLYSFQFEPPLTSLEGNILIPASIKGFEKASSFNSTQCVFAATLIDAKYDRWSIEQCDFTANQIRSLTVANKPPFQDRSPVTVLAGDGFDYEI